MKSEKELEQLKQEYQELKNKLSKLSEEELRVITGGNSWNEYWGEDGFFRLRP